MAIENKIAILLCTYNGDKYLREQLDSIINQTFENWIIYASDDGSTDATLSILNEFQSKIGPEKMYILQGPKKGFASNFITSLQNNGQDCSYFSFCDQDDIWVNNKLEKAIDKISQESIDPLNDYVLYGARTWLIDENGSNIGISPNFKRPLGLRNALVQSFSGGNTMLFTHALRDKICCLPQHFEIISHDWVLYILCSALKGIVIFDKDPCLFYRQHENNLVGSNLGIRSKLLRLKKIYRGELKQWNTLNKKFIFLYKEYIDYSDWILIENYYSNNGNNLFSFLKSRVYRQSLLETIIFTIMALGKKLN